MAYDREKFERLVAEINAVALPVARQRIETMGVDGAGAYNFYQTRVERGDLFAGYDHKLATQLAADPECPLRLVEVGGGYGTFAWLMAAAGYETVCCEQDHRRYDGAVALWEAVRPTLAAPAELRFVASKFPASEGVPLDSWVVITNLVATATPEQRMAIIAAMARHEGAIVDIDRFLEHRHSDEEREALLAEFADSGLVGEPYLDLGAEARIYRLRPVGTHR